MNPTLKNSQQQRDAIRRRHLCKDFISTAEAVLGSVAETDFQVLDYQSTRLLIDDSVATLVEKASERYNVDFSDRESSDDELRHLIANWFQTDSVFVFLEDSAQCGVLKMRLDFFWDKIIDILTQLSEIITVLSADMTLKAIIDYVEDGTTKRIDIDVRRGFRIA